MEPASNIRDPLTEAAQAADLPFEPAPLFRETALQDDSSLADCQGKRIGILIVAYNAASTLASVLKRITPNVWKNVEEVVVFDDASHDSTYEVAIGLKVLRNLPKLTVIKHSQNLGYGGNQKAGYQYLIDRGFDIVVLLHGDGQYAPEILARLYAPLVTGQAEAVFGTRMTNTYGGPMKGGMPLYKFVGNRILSWFENRALDLKLSEFHSGYRAYSLDALRQIEMAAMTDDFHFDTEIIVKLHHQGFRIREVPIPTYYGDEICHVNGLRYAKDVARAVFRYRMTTRGVRPYPEFREYWVHYSLKEGLYSSHYYVFRHVSGPLSVLDVGCGHGFIAERLAATGCRVTGVDELPEPDRLDALQSYHRCDLMGGLDPVLPELRQSRFDRILLLDVLEHLPRPEQVLLQVRPLLADGGRILVSVPNVANFSTRLMLLFGRWEYADRGIMDRTHLKFFTRRTARRMIEQQGYEIVDQKSTIIPVDLLFGIPPRSRLMRFIATCLHALTGLMPGLFAYQCIFLAAPKASRERESSPGSPPPTRS